MTETLANKYRPQTFDDLCSQEITKTILKKQIANKTYSHAMLFVGQAGSGKTSSAKIIAKMIDGEILEYDCASNNGVDAIKAIINNARIPSLIHEYKTIILDEVHVLSAMAWASLLITLEENLPKAIFILCTTDVQKIPDTIMSRVQRFNFIPLTRPIIVDRLKYVCEKENIDIKEDALNVIAKLAKGNMRQALTNLDKCILYDDLSLEGVQRVLNVVSDNVYKDLYDAIYNNGKAPDINRVAYVINHIYLEGYELHFAIRQFLDYLLANKGDLSIIEATVNLIQEIRYDTSPRTLIIARYITIRK